MITTEMLQIHLMKREGHTGRTEVIDLACLLIARGVGAVHGGKPGQLARKAQAQRRTRDVPKHEPYMLEAGPQHFRKDLVVLCQTGFTPNVDLAFIIAPPLNYKTRPPQLNYKYKPPLNYKTSASDVVFMFCGLLFCSSLQYRVASELRLRRFSIASTA